MMYKRNIFIAFTVIFIVGGCATNRSNTQIIYDACFPGAFEKAKSEKDFKTEKEAKYYAHLMCKIESGTCVKKPETCQKLSKKYKVKLNQ